MTDTIFTVNDYRNAIDRELEKRKTTYPKIIKKKIKQDISEIELYDLKNKKQNQNIVLSQLHYLLSFPEEEQYYSEVFECMRQEIRRELDMRKKYYPRLIYLRRITPETAEYEYAVWASLFEWFRDKYINPCSPS